MKLFFHNLLSSFLKDVKKHDLFQENSMKAELTFQELSE